MKVFVIGAGRMGASIAESFLEAGHEVWLHDSIDAAVDYGARRILNQLIEKKGEEEAMALTAKLHKVTDFKEAHAMDLVIESIFENASMKKDLLYELDEVCSPKAILACNTATLSISELSQGLAFPNRVCGMHFYSIDPSYQLVEIIPGAFTSKETLEKAKEYTLSIHKTPVLCQESPGFLVNRLLMSMINEACNMIMEGVTTAEDIDLSMKLVLQAKEGPLHLADKMGNDNVLQIMQNIFEETGDPKYRPSPQLRRMVRSNLLGERTGEGFFVYKNKDKHTLEN